MEVVFATEQFLFDPQEVRNSRKLRNQQASSPLFIFIAPLLVRPFFLAVPRGIRALVILFETVIL